MTFFLLKINDRNLAEERKRREEKNLEREKREKRETTLKCCHDRRLEAAA